MERLYFDYNANTPIRPEVIDIMAEIMSVPGNASSVHYHGRLGRKHVEHARKIIAEGLNSRPEQVVFNSGATESNNTILKHFDEEDIWVSAVEHSSVSRVVADARRIPVTKDGVVDLEALKEMLEAGPLPKLISVMFVNSETGVIQPIKEICDLAHHYGIKVHSDAVQAIGRVKVDMKALGLDYLSLSAHKIGGPQGCGALVLGPCEESPRFMHGGSQENHRRAGSENVAGIAGFGKAMELALGQIDHYEGLSKWRDKIQDAMCAAEPSMVVNGKNAPRTGNTLNISWPGQLASMLLMNFDLEGVSLSTGSACSSGSIKPSPVIKAMGADDDVALGTLRISMGWNTKEAEVDAFIERWKKIATRVQEGVKAEAEKVTA